MFVLSAIWFLSAVFNYGFTFAYFQREWPEMAKEDRGDDALFAAFVAIVGPIGTVFLILNKGLRHGWHIS